MKALVSAIPLGLLFAVSMYPQIITTVAGTATWRQVVSVAIDLWLRMQPS